MLTLNEVYALPGKPVPLTDWVLRQDWFPELGGIWRDSTEVLEAMERDARLTVSQLMDDYIDGRRTRAMHTLRFDGKPVAIVQNAGREGDDHRKRWVTDREVYAELLAYLCKQMLEAGDSDDFADPTQPLYEEEVFHFYGDDHAARFGYESEPRRKDVLVIANERSVCPTLPTDHLLVFLKAGVEDVPEFVRRQAFVMQKVRQLTEQELLEGNPRIVEVNKQDGIDRVYLFRPCKRPLNQPVQSL